MTREVKWVNFGRKVRVLRSQDLLILDQGFFNLCDMMDVKVKPEKNILKSCILGNIEHSICVLISQDPMQRFFL